MSTPTNNKGEPSPPGTSTAPGAPARKRAYPRYYDKEVEELIFPKKLTFEFTPKTFRVNSASDENTNEFWATPGTVPVGNTVLVKRVKDGMSDNVFLLRLNARSTNGGTKLKFPSFWISTVVKKMEQILQHLEPNSDGQMAIPECQTVIPRDELSTDGFWQHPSTINIARLKMRPYLSEFHTLMFRLHTEVDSKFHKVYENESGDVMWKGPACSISASTFIELADALKTLAVSPPEHII